MWPTWKFYNRSRGEAGVAPRSPVVGTFIYCTETEEEADEGYTRWLPGFRFSATKHYEFEDPDHFGATSGYEQYAQRAPSGPVERPSHEQVSADRAAWHTSAQAEQARMEAGAVIGTPEQCIAKLKRAMETTAPVHMFGFVRFGGMPYDKAQRSLELFAKEVLPEVHKTPMTDPIV